MTRTRTIEKAGRIVLPKAVRRELQLNPGNSLEADGSRERIVLHPARGNGRIYKKQEFGFSILENRWAPTMSTRRFAERERNVTAVIGGNSGEAGPNRTPNRTYGTICCTSAHRNSGTG